MGQIGVMNICFPQCVSVSLQQGDPHWTAIASSLIAPLVALIAAYLAFRQWQTAKNKLKLDLFDKRFLVFMATKEFIGHIVIKGRPEQDKQTEFLMAISGAGFLFDDAISSYLDEVWSRSVEVESWSMSDNKAEEARQRGEHMKWFNEQLRKIEGVFKDYLQLSH